MVKVIITAPRGQMDSLIVEEAWKNEAIEIVGCVGRPGADYIGKDIGTVVPAIGEKTGITVCESINEVIDKCDLVVDFSSVELSMEVLECCKKAGKALICGTTGFSDEQTEKILAAGETIPVMKAANTSYVVNVMQKLLAEAAAMLGEKCKIEVIDMHDQYKKDAPSGTAIELGEAMAEAAPDKTYDDITFHSVRAGNTPSSHRIIFGCRGEMLQISHDAYDHRCFALGACDAVLFMAGKPAGVYSMGDVADQA